MRLRFGWLYIYVYTDILVTSYTYVHTHSLLERKVSGHFAGVKKKKLFPSNIIKWGVLKNWFCYVDRTFRVSIYMYSGLAPDLLENHTTH